MVEGDGGKPQVHVVRRARFSEQGAVIACLIVAVAGSAALLIAWDSHLSFIADDWELLAGRPGWSPRVFLDPFNGNIVLGPALAFKLLQAVFGMRSALPFYVVSVSLSLASGGLLFVWLRRRVGDWLALLGAASILFLGAAFEDFLWAFQMGYFGSMAAGLGMLVALDRGDRRGDRIACALLTVSLAFSSIGIAFAAGALVDIALGRRPRRSRAYVGLVPLALFGLWWVGWGHTAESYVSLSNLEHLPRYTFEAAAAGVTSLLGLASKNSPEASQPHLILGKLLLILAIVLVIVRIVYERRISPGLAIVLVIGLTLWMLSGLNRTPERFPTSSRYQYPSAVFLLLIAAEALRGLPVPRLAIAAAAVVVGFGVWGGLTLMAGKYSEHWRPRTESLRASLAAIEIAGPAASKEFQVSFPPSVAVPYRIYLSAVRANGSPAFSERQLEERSEAERIAVDRTMANVLGLAFQPPRSSERTIRCKTLRASSTGTRIPLSDRRHTLTKQAGTPVEVLLNRFAASPSVRLGILHPGTKTAVTIPADASDRPWNLDLKGRGPVRLCTT